MDEHHMFSDIHAEYITNRHRGKCAYILKDEQYNGGEHTRNANTLQYISLLNKKKTPNEIDNIP